ncbi:MAG: GGDEF domain-containing protein [Patescibacteria group bacterium]
MTNDNTKTKKNNPKIKETYLESITQKINFFIQEKKELLSPKARGLFKKIKNIYEIYDEKANKKDFVINGEVLKIFDDVNNFSELNEFDFNKRIKSIIDKKIKLELIDLKDKEILTEMIEANNALRIENLRDKMDEDVLIPDIKNRRGFKKELTRAIEQHKKKLKRKRKEKIGVIIYFDIDNFGMFNKKYGHKIGDEVLKKVAKIFKDRTYPIDTVARLGGDEFIIYLDNTSIKSLSRVHKNHNEAPFERFLGVLNSIYIDTLDGKKQITLSCGASDFEIDINTDTATLIENNMHTANKFLMQVAKKEKNNTHSTIALSDGTLVKVRPTEN